MLGAFDEEFAGEPTRWQVSLSWRYQRSDRHFVGTDEQEERQEEGSEVVNDINLADIGIRYNFSPRNSVTVSIPYLMAERSSPLRLNGVVVDRTKTQARGLGDITVVARRLLIDPTEKPKGNVSVGIGAKLPTGAANVQDARTRIVNGQRVISVETVDQSIQPGDGGFGFIVDLSAYRQLGSSGRVAAYGGGTYLFNPEGESGVLTFRGRASEAIMSIADQYLVRAGIQAAPESWNGFGVGLGARLEGVAVHDVFGSSTGFRRPGYGLSVEPSLTWSKGKRTFALSVPIAIERNRQRSVSDLMDGTHGDAAFADWLAIVSYWYRF